MPPAVSLPWMAVAAAVWLATWWISVPAAPLPSAPFEGEVTVSTDPFVGEFGSWVVGTIGERSVLVDLGDHGVPALGRGDRLALTGEVSSKAGSAAGHAYRGIVHVDQVVAHQRSRFLLHRLGHRIRAHVGERLAPFDDGRALLAGFLIGETDAIDRLDVEAMRKSGLAHFVAVSGSNVALVLILVAVIAGPLGAGPKRRAIMGLAVLPVYAAATRFEPSVMRASLMASLVLGGRLFGIVLEAWQLLALAVTVLVVADPGLTSNVGFQLSVAATAGVIVGARWPVSTKLLRGLAVTIGAQAAVAPLLLIHFGRVPLLSPLANVVAAPIVAAATVIGALGVVLFGFLIGPAAWMADLVLGVARLASGWPQLGPGSFGMVVVAAVVSWALPGLRATLALVAAGLMTVALVTAGARVPAGAAVVLDVGQGDAVLLHGGAGRYALVDGGPDRSTLLELLERYGVKHLELVVLTHVHADHATGLSALPGRLSIGAMWAASAPHQTAASETLFTEMARVGVEPITPQPGEVWPLGSIILEVHGPVRRYASPNDQSIVVTAHGPQRSLLLPGDIETFAQADLRGLQADVLKVPHQGAATSDPSWLESVGADLAVISVGPNDFGHPALWVIETLRAAGAEVIRTDVAGDVLIDLS